MRIHDTHYIDGSFSAKWCLRCPENKGAEGKLICPRRRRSGFICTAAAAQILTTVDDGGRG
jgi:hypothetical protein